MAMPYETILFEIKDGAAKLTLNRPDRLNSFTVQMHEEVADALTRVEAEGARALLLTGAGRGFCAGQDLNDRAVAPGDEAPDLGESVEKRYNPLISGWSPCRCRWSARSTAWPPAPGPTSRWPATSSWPPARPSSSRASPPSA